jgi:hypothetical protein
MAKNFSRQQQRVGQNIFWDFKSREPTIFDGLPRIFGCRTMKVLSHHEIAKLVVVYGSTERIAPSDPDVLALQRANLVEVFANKSDHLQFCVTAKGTEFLSRLGFA